MTLEILATYAAAISLLIGAAFVLVGVIGLLKFNDPMTRLHAPTKVGTVGIGMLLLASILTAAITIPAESKRMEVTPDGRASFYDGENR